MASPVEKGRLAFQRGGFNPYVSRRFESLTLKATCENNNRWARLMPKLAALSPLLKGADRKGVSNNNSDRSSLDHWLCTALLGKIR
jgi:hypothetical protein